MPAGSEDFLWYKQINVIMSITVLISPMLIILSLSLYSMDEKSVSRN